MLFQSSHKTQFVMQQHAQEKSVFVMRLHFIFFWGRFMRLHFIDHIIDECVCTMQCLSPFFVLKFLLGHLILIKYSLKFLAI